MAQPKRSPRRNTGKLFVISAPSGCGKTTLCKRLVADYAGLRHSISVTTRPPRPGEKNGVDYHFVSERRFREMIARRALLEYEENFGYLYGTPKKFITDRLNKGMPTLLSIDVKGAMKIRKAFGKKSVLIFILPPSSAVLEKRLCSRKSDDPSTISARLEEAKRELSYKGRYDYRIVNDRLDSTSKRLKRIVVSELDKRADAVVGGI